MAAGDSSRIADELAELMGDEEEPSGEEAASGPSPPAQREAPSAEGTGGDDDDEGSIEGRLRRIKEKEKKKRERLRAQREKQQERKGELMARIEDMLAQERDIRHRATKQYKEERKQITRDTLQVHQQQRQQMAEEQAHVEKARTEAFQKEVEKRKGLMGKQHGEMKEEKQRQRDERKAQSEQQKEAMRSQIQEYEKQQQKRKEKVETAMDRFYSERRARMEKEKEEEETEKAANRETHGQWCQEREKRTVMMDQAVGERLKTMQEKADERVQKQKRERQELRENAIKASRERRKQALADVAEKRKEREDKEREEAKKRSEDAERRAAKRAEQAEKEQEQLTADRERWQQMGTKRQEILTALADARDKDMQDFLDRVQETRNKQAEKHAAQRKTEDDFWKDVLAKRAEMKAKAEQRHEQEVMAMVFRERLIRERVDEIRKEHWTKRHEQTEWAAYLALLKDTCTKQLADRRMAEKKREAEREELSELRRQERRERQQLAAQLLEDVDEKSKAEAKLRGEQRALRRLELRQGEEHRRRLGAAEVKADTELSRRVWREERKIREQNMRVHIGAAFREGCDRTDRLRIARAAPTPAKGTGRAATTTPQRAGGRHSSDGHAATPQPVGSTSLLQDEPPPLIPSHAQDPSADAESVMALQEQRLRAKPLAAARDPLREWSAVVRSRISSPEAAVCADAVSVACAVAAVSALPQSRTLPAALQRGGLMRCFDALHYTARCLTGRWQALWWCSALPRRGPAPPRRKAAAEGGAEAPAPAPAAAAPEAVAAPEAAEAPAAAEGDGAPAEAPAAEGGPAAEAAAPAAGTPEKGGAEAEEPPRPRRRALLRCTISWAPPLPHAAPAPAPPAPEGGGDGAESGAAPPAVEVHVALSTKHATAAEEGAELLAACSAPPVPPPPHVQDALCGAAAHPAALLAARQLLPKVLPELGGLLAHLRAPPAAADGGQTEQTEGDREQPPAGPRVPVRVTVSGHCIGGFAAPIFALMLRSELAADADTVWRCVSLGAPSPFAPGAAPAPLQPGGPVAWESIAAADDAVAAALSGSEPGGAGLRAALGRAAWVGGRSGVTSQYALPPGTRAAPRGRDLCPSPRHACAAALGAARSAAAYLHLAYAELRSAVPAAPPGVSNVPQWCVLRTPEPPPELSRDPVAAACIRPASEGGGLRADARAVLSDLHARFAPPAGEAAPDADQPPGLDEQGLCALVAAADGAWPSYVAAEVFGLPEGGALSVEDFLHTAERLAWADPQLLGRLLHVAGYSVVGGELRPSKALQGPDGALQRRTAAPAEWRCARLTAAQQQQSDGGPVLTPSAEQAAAVLFEHFARRRTVGRPDAPPLLAKDGFTRLWHASEYERAVGSSPEPADRIWELLTASQRRAAAPAGGTEENCLTAAGWSAAFARLCAWDEAEAWRRLAVLGFTDGLQPPDPSTIPGASPSREGQSLASPPRHKFPWSPKRSPQCARKLELSATYSVLSSADREQLSRELAKAPQRETPNVKRAVSADAPPSELARHLAVTENAAVRARIERLLQLERELKEQEPSLSQEGSSPKRVKETSRHLYHASVEKEAMIEAALHQSACRTKHDGQPPKFGASRRLFNPDKPGHGGVVKRKEPDEDEEKKQFPPPDPSPGELRYLEAFVQKMYKGPWEKAKNTAAHSVKKHTGPRPEPLALPQHRIAEIVRRHAEDAAKKKRQTMERGLEALIRADLEKVRKLSQETQAAVTQRLYDAALQHEKHTTEKLVAKYPPGGDRRERWGGGSMSPKDVKTLADRLNAGRSSENVKMPAMYRRA